MSSFLVLGIDQTNLVYRNHDQGRVYQNCKFHFPWGWGSCARAWPYAFFFKNLLLYSQAQIRQTKYIVIITKEGSTQIVNFMTIWVWILVLGCGYIIRFIVKMHYFFKMLLLYTQAQNSQTASKVMMMKEGSTKNVNLMTPRAGVLVLVCS